MIEGKRRHHNLQVWQLGMSVVEEVYALTRNFPNFETYGLCSQMQRSAVSIPSNIAEGAARSGTKEFLHFLSIARGSLCELETQLMISQRLGYLSNELTILKTVNELFAKLNALIAALKEKV
ncbi:four helix bundle protein [Geothermobacter hydrogeniphilus]|uniref:Four helix bundle protein n=1 Tax=Geothermobacter hydrogeniphilus TaxID=1969733 RepID=A0A1X0XIY3_9BACT|nr:four helix bundle protein [Geothermobacter hydrogeniphilus]ORJ52862.1 four helix bundle protein [Geothermobacter hydrogeniphilus]